MATTVSKNSNGKTGRKPTSSSLRDSALRRFFGEYEVVEATEALHLQPQQCDIETAKRDDPANCAFSRACQRMYGSKFVLFFGSVAYVDLLDGHERKIKRFAIDKVAQTFIKDFDAGKKVKPGGFRLCPAPPTKTLEGLSEYRKRRRERVREAMLQGEKYVPDARFRTDGVKHPNAKRIHNFRSGAGMVHFPEAREQGK